MYNTLICEVLSQLRVVMTAGVHVLCFSGTRGLRQARQEEEEGQKETKKRN